MKFVCFGFSIAAIAFLFNRDGENLKNLDPKTTLGGAATTTLCWYSKTVDCPATTNLCYDRGCDANYKCLVNKGKEYVQNREKVEQAGQLDSSKNVGIVGKYGKISLQDGICTNVSSCKPDCIYYYLRFGWYCETDKTTTNSANLIPSSQPDPNSKDCP